MPFVKKSCESVTRQSAESLERDLLWNNYASRNAIKNELVLRHHHFDINKYRFLSYLDDYIVVYDTEKEHIEVYDFFYRLIEKTFYMMMGGTSKNFFSKTISDCGFECISITQLRYAHVECYIFVTLPTFGEIFCLADSQYKDSLKFLQEQGYFTSMKDNDPLVLDMDNESEDTFVDVVLSDGSLNFSIYDLKYMRCKFIDSFFDFGNAEQIIIPIMNKKQFMKCRKYCLSTRSFSFPDFESIKCLCYLGASYLEELIRHFSNFATVESM